MPLGLEASADSEQQQQQQQRADPDPTHQTWNPLSWGKEVQAFVDWVLELTERDGRTLSAEEWQRVATALQTFNALQKYSIGSALARGGIAWYAALLRNDYSAYTTVRS